MITYISSPKNPRGKFYYHLHFVDENQVNAQRNLSESPKVTQ